MLTMRDHGVEDYVDLRDMDTSDVGELTADDRACLAELGQFLVDVDVADRFAMWLLHKHFEPSHGEVFLERTLTSPRHTETTLVDRSKLAGGALCASAIRLGTADGVVEVVGMEFAAPEDMAGVSPLSADDGAVLTGIAERLRAHGKIGRFGVKLIRDPLGLTETELLLEISDSGERALYCKVSDRAQLPTNVKIIETVWKFRLVEGRTAPVVMQDCTAGCVSVPGGHDIGHSHSQTDNDDNPL